MTTPVTTTDFSGVFTLAAPSATAASNAAGNVVVDQVSSLHYLSLGSTSNAGSLAQNAPIAVEPLFATSRKALVNAVKKTGATWTAGQKLYLKTTGAAWQTTSTGASTCTGIAIADAASAASVGTVLPAVPL
jgi:predicted RecA/RadA family phage recombinase